MQYRYDYNRQVLKGNAHKNHDKKFVFINMFLETKNGN